MFRFLLVRFSYVRVFHSICFSFPLFDFLVYLPAASSMQSESSVRSERWLTKKDVLKTDEKRKGKRKEKKLFVFLFPSCAPPAAKPNLTAALASLAGRQSSLEAAFLSRSLRRSQDACVALPSSRNHVVPVMRFRHAINNINNNKIVTSLVVVN